MSSAVTRMTAWQRRLATVLVPLAVVGAISLGPSGPSGWSRPFLDIRLVAAAPGSASISGVQVTYDAGSLRRRTAVLSASTCLHASSDWRGDLTSSVVHCGSG